MKALLRTIAEAVFLLAAAPFLLLLELLALWLTDAVSLLANKIPMSPPAGPLVRDSDTHAVSVVIPTWNGKHHLEANLRSVTAAVAGRPGSEVIVVENASEDGSAELLRERFPEVRCLRQAKNLGFGAGSNAGFRAARNDIVVLLNNDMRVDPGFLEPLLEGFRELGVFAVTAQIFFTDRNKRREETGLTTGRWEQGRLRLGHRIDAEIDELFPAFYAGGGSTAYDRKKFLELGGFDPILHPFYMEDADVSYLAWKRGWKVLYAPGSVVYHEHRGTIGKKFSPASIERTIQKNHLLFVWKNIHEPGRLAGHFLWTWGALWVRLLAGPSPTRPDSAAWLTAFSQTFQVCASRLRARRLATISDTEALNRPRPGYYRDRFHRFESKPEAAELKVLFVSPYGIEPPIHGGAVFMNQTLRHLAKRTKLHLFCLVDEEKEVATNRRLGEECASAEIRVRLHDPRKGGDPWTPYPAQQFSDEEIEWRLQRSIFLNRIDVVQIEYTQLATYGYDFGRIATFLFEHDIYFQSVARSMRTVKSLSLRARHFHEYLRALRFERRALRRFDAVQVCTRTNERYLRSFAWKAPPIEAGYRAGIDVGRYRFVDEGREPDTLLFVGNFKHPPNQSALEWFVREVWPLVRARRPAARLIAVGAQAPVGFKEQVAAPGVEFAGEVEDIRDPMNRYAVFVAPIQTGSGVRVKLLEAFAAGIPVASTRIGAEGLADGASEARGGIVELGDTAEDFAAATLRLLEAPEQARELAGRARAEVERHWDMATITGRLVERYAEVVRRKRSGS